MSESAPSNRGTGTASGFRGLMWGLGAGASIWGLYFLQAGAWDAWFWDVTVLPALGLVLVVALVVAAMRPRLRRFVSGLAVGALLTLPAVLLAAGLLLAGLDLE